MNPALILLPVFAQVALTFAMLFLTASARLGAVRSGAVKIRDIALGQRGWPEKVQLYSNNFENQFQLPMLFYVLCGLALVTRQTDMVLLALAWLFVALRVLHSYIHTSNNHVPTRFRLFASGFFVLIAAWSYFAAKIIPQVV